MRYAVYFTPAQDHALTRQASAWLGRDAFDVSRASAPKAALPAAPNIEELTAEPRRYGFHATLKAPFRLHPEKTEADLLAAFTAFCARQATIEVPDLRIVQLDSFFALVPGGEAAELQSFGASIMHAFEPFRAPLSDDDIARRNPQTLTERQRQNLLTYGYPYVLEDFRFHMTLTGKVEQRNGAAVRSLLESRFAPHVNRPLSINGLAVFVERAPGAPFTVLTWQALKPAQSHG